MIERPELMIELVVVMTFEVLLYWEILGFLPGYRHLLSIVEK